MHLPYCRVMLSQVVCCRPAMPHLRICDLLLKKWKKKCAGCSSRGSTKVECKCSIKYLSQGFYRFLGH